MRSFRSGKTVELCDTCFKVLEFEQVKFSSEDRVFCGQDCADNYKQPSELRCAACDERVGSQELVCWNCKKPLVDLTQQEGVTVHDQSSDAA